MKKHTVLITRIYWDCCLYTAEPEYMPVYLIHAEYLAFLLATFRYSGWCSSLAIAMSFSLIVFVTGSSCRRRKWCQTTTTTAAPFFLWAWIITLRGSATTPADSGKTTNGYGNSFPNLMKEWGGSQIFIYQPFSHWIRNSLEVED